MAGKKDIGNNPSKAAQKSKVTIKKAPRKDSDNIKETVAEKKQNQIQEKGFLVEAAENIETGAKVVSDKTSEMVSDLAVKTSQVAGTIFEKMKQSATDVYKAGSKLVVNATETAQDYADEYQSKMELKSLITEQQALYTELGSALYLKNKSGKMPIMEILQEKDISDLLQMIKINEGEINRMRKELEIPKK